MPQHFAQLFYHLVFSTKHREPWLTPLLRARLFAYFGDLLARRQGILLAVGGVEDHVHLLASLRPSHPVSTVVKELKGASSH